jgi:hypothetical protein
MAILKSIGVLSLAKICAVFYAIIGLVVGIFGTAVIGLMSKMTGLPATAAAGGIVAIIGTVIIFAIIGFIIGAIFALIYNVLAAVLGGIRLDLT